MVFPLPPGRQQPGPFSNTSEQELSPERKPATSVQAQPGQSPFREAQLCHELQRLLGPSQRSTMYLPLLCWGEPMVQSPPIQVSPQHSPPLALAIPSQLEPRSTQVPTRRTTPQASPVPSAIQGAPSRTKRVWVRINGKLRRIFLRRAIKLGLMDRSESEQERLLSITARLPNGKNGHVFELSFHNGSEHWYCNLCECPIMGRVYHHEIGKRHTNNMQNAGHHISQVPVEPEPPLQIAPGEPVPPGFENELKKTAQIQERLDSFTVGPLVGLEYLFELTEYDRDKEPSYLCLLCDKRGDPRTVIAHLASYNHIIQYTQRHFVTCYRALSPYITKQYKRNWQATMQKIAEAIEVKFGRLKPHVVDRETFEKKRIYFQNIVATGPHFNERTGITFEELVVKEELTKPVEDDLTITKPSDTQDMSKRSYRKSGTEPGADERKKRSPSPPVVAKPKKPKPAPVGNEKRRSLSSVSSISSSDLSEFDPSDLGAAKRGNPNKERAPFKRKTARSRSPVQKHRRNRSRSFSPYRGYNRDRRPLHPWQRSDYIRSRTETSVDRNKQKNDKLDEYKRLATAIENDMERVLKQHEKNPEKHPQYNEEWKKFWNKRYKELQGEGKDATNYDFKPEWIEFWNKRMSELHGLEIKTKKDALRKRLGLPEEPAPICFKITGRRKAGQRDEKDTKPPPMASAPDQDPDVIVIEDKDEDTISSKRSHSPWESESSSRPISRRSRDRTRSRSRERSHVSREGRSRERSRGHARSRSRSREKNWRGRDRDRDFGRDYGRDKYYREPYRKSELPDYLKPPRVMRDVTRHPVMSPPEIHRMPEPDPDPEEESEVNVVGVLRLLTALEEKLGSLGPKVIDLLGQALAMEKNEANSSETLLDSDVNCVLFETVKEKLKGQLLAGLVDFAQEKAFKNAIKKIASVIYFAGERKKEREKNKPKVDPIKVPGVGTVDKAAIAKQIATALVLQGKTDVTQVELEQLINAVVGMAEASRNSEKPMTTATFLQQLSQPKPENKAEPPSAPLQTLQTPPPETTTTSNSMEGLSDSDLQTLLQNFKDLCTDEQHSLISYLKKLEAKEPERVERLRKFVNLDSSGEKEKKPEGRTSPFAEREAGLNPSVEEPEKEKEEEVKPKVVIQVDSDDDDYSYEDVFKVAKQNVKEKEEKEKEKKLQETAKSDEFDISSAKSLIANIMGQIKGKQESPKLLGLSTPSPTAPVKPIAPQIANLANFPINLQSLADAVSSVQKSEAAGQSNFTLKQPAGQSSFTSKQPAGQSNFTPKQPNLISNSSQLSNQPSFTPNLNPANNFPRPDPQPVRPPNLSARSPLGLNPGMNRIPPFGGPRPNNTNFNNYPPVSYPQQNPYNNNYDRPPADRYGRFGNPNAPPFGGRPRQFDNYGNRW